MGTLKIGSFTDPKYFALLTSPVADYRGPQGSNYQAHRTGIKKYRTRIATCKTLQNYKIII
jgi:hypothetical protein